MSQEHTVEEMKKYWFFAGQWHDADCACIRWDEGVCNCKYAENKKRVYSILHHSHTEEVEAYRLAISKIANELREAGFRKAANQIDHDLKILAKNPTIETLNTHSS